ncbi:MAG: UDP-N-acetylmuramoyl-L-alanyl-D-glutamate--2,6-diaminopimelate ligase [Hyphomicrobiaceae bacterium]
MRLAALFGSEAVAPADGADVEITSLTADSRTVVPGALFAALPGSTADGAAFVADAIAHGAAAVLLPLETSVSPVSVPVLRAADPRRALALMAAAFYDRQPKIMLAVTGTSGKTSVAEFTRQILAGLGRRAASLGTMGLVTPEGAVYGGLTTPDPIALHSTLARLADEGIDHLAFEASSHGLDQRRLDGVRLTAAAFTNLGRDHLDYHASIDDYFQAKLRLFDILLPSGRPAVVNADGAGAAEVVAVARRRGLPAIGTGRAGETLKLRDVRPHGFAQHLTVEHDGRVTDIRLPLLGAYQADNALLAAGLAVATGAEAARVLPLLETLIGVKGRLEVVAETRGGLVVVDYAHKPEALQAALAALRPFASGRLICVFGCGGNRDRGKRPVMGRIAAAAADLTIVTDDNPRREDPAVIRAEILAGAAGAREIADRGAAIDTAIGLMTAGDVVLIAGKGHETGQIVGSTVLPFSDHDVVRAALGRPS